MANTSTIVSTPPRQRKIAELKKKIATKEYMHMAINKIAADLTQQLFK